jgi:hypothetical protein
LPIRRCENDIGVHVHGNAARVCAALLSPSRGIALGYATDARFADAEPGLRAVDGSDPPLSMPGAAWGRFGMCMPIPTAPAGRYRSISPCRKAVEPAGTFAMLGPRPTSCEGAVGDRPEGQGVVTTIPRTAPHGAEPVQRRLRPQPLQRTPVPFVFPSVASPDGNTKVVCKIVAEGSPPVAARPTRWPERARSWPSSSAGPGRVTLRTTRALPGWEEGSTPAEGRAASVPEAGGTGADAAATPTTPPPVTTQTHEKSTASTGGDRWSAGEHPATGRMERSARRKRANQPRPLPQRRRPPGGQRGHGPPPAPPADTRSVATEGRLACPP